MEADTAGDFEGICAQLREYQAALFLAEDGVYGPATRAAVLAFQQAAGLPETGFVDAVTWLAIRQQVNLENEEGAAWQES